MDKRSTATWLGVLREFARQLFSDSQEKVIRSLYRKEWNRVMVRESG